VARLLCKTFPTAIDQAQTLLKVPAPDSPPIPGLALRRGFKCTQCDKIVSDTKSGPAAMSTHFQQHRAIRRTRGGDQRTPHTRSAHLHEDGMLIFTRVGCQRFFATHRQSSYFPVAYSPDQDATVNHAVVTQEDARKAALSREALLHELVNTELESSRVALEAGIDICQSPLVVTEADPWLEATRWRQLFHRIPLLRAATLGHMPIVTTEPELCILDESVDRLVDQAYAAVCNDKIGFFDQFRINSFVKDDARRAGEKALMVKLRKESYRAYKYTWKRLLCFVCRTSQQEDDSSRVRLPHQYTTAQLTCIHEAVEYAKRACQQDQGKTKDTRALDRATLLLCIALLDHPLRGSVFESAVVVFLAVLGIDEKNPGALHDAVTYSPVLSKFVKIAQMLVIQRAVLAVEDGNVEYPADMLDDLRQRFLVQGSRSPFDWACKQRQVARRLASNMTAAGTIIWTEDCQKVVHHEVSLTMGGLRDFVAAQVQLAQKELNALLMLHPEESRSEVIPPLWMYKLEDNHANNQAGWSFLKDARNAEVLKCGGNGAGRWLLDRVIEHEWLSDEFLDLVDRHKVKWRRKRVERYFRDVDLFLERLLLLVHVTSGQPARGTELLTLRHTNTSSGHHRSIFIENGLVGTVTSYHKGYNITNTLKIIHRYLPKEVSELLVYYLWLVLPFREKLDVLVYKRRKPPSPYL
jgi:hypothetical protein